MFNHPVGCGLAQSFSVLVDDRLLIVECLGIVDQAFAIAFDLCKGSVFAVVESLLNHVQGKWHPGELVVFWHLILRKLVLSNTSWDVRGGTHFARQCHEVHSNRSSTVQRQSHFPSLHMLPRARTSCLWPASSCRGTSSPSPLSIRPFLRWRPVCTKDMVSTVFSIAHSCSVLHARLHRGAVWCSRSAAGRWCEVLPVGRPGGSIAPTSRCTSRSAPNTARTSPHIACDAANTIAHHWGVHVPALSAASQADPRQGSAQCRLPCASTHSPFSRNCRRVVYRSCSWAFRRILASWCRCTALLGLAFSTASQ